MLTEAIGWAAAGILLLTRSRQVWSQWRSGAVGGISSWLFVGQVSASAMLTLYSVLLGSAVFIATNSRLLVNALAGLMIDRRNRRLQSRREDARGK